MVDWSYVASLFDHKGNLNLINVNGREYFQLRIYSSHKDTLEEVKEFLECGNIYHKKLSRKNKNWKDKFELTITTKKDIFIVLTQMLPFLMRKKKEVESILKTHKLFKDFEDISKEAKKSQAASQTIDDDVVTNLRERGNQPEELGECGEQGENEAQFQRAEKEPDEASYIG